MVLQRAPAKAAVYGFGAGPVSVKVVGTKPRGGAVSYTVGADHFEADTMPGNSLGQARYIKNI